MFKKVSILLLLLSGLDLAAQYIDTTQVGFTTIEHSSVQYFDTLLSVDDYHFFNDYGKDDFGIISMGNQGDVRHRLKFKSLTSIKPNLGIDGYFKNHQQTERVPLYNVKVPTGGVRMLTGYEKGQMFGGFFTVNPISRLNVFLDYQRINSRGNYFNQQNISDRLQVSSSYTTKDGFYKSYGIFCWNRSENLEYGGIADPLDFEDNVFSNRELIPVNLLYSASKTRASHFLLNQNVRLFKLDSVSDVRLVYQFDYSDQYVAFKSADSAFVHNAIFETGTIRDSIRLQLVENFGGVKLDAFGQVFEGGINYSYYKFGNAYLIQSDNLISLKLKATGRVKGFEYIGHWQNYFNGSYGGSYHFNLLLNYRTATQDFDIGANLTHGLYNPGLFSTKYISNNFVWQNGYKQILRTALSAKIRYKNFWLEAGAQQLNNHVYFNEFAVPDQFIGSIGVYHAELQANFKIVGGLRLDNRIRYQLSDNTDIVRMPDWIIRQALYYDVDAFRRALLMSFGVEFQYFSSFASEAYMPATTVMYLQNDDMIGDFPYFNFFLNFKIKEFAFFVRLENITQGLFGYDYYAAPLYPLPDFNFRVGASWRFFN